MSVLVFVNPPGCLQELDQGSQLILRQVPQLPKVALAHALVELRQQCPARRRQPNQHHPPIVGRALAFDQAALFQLIEQPGDVGARETSLAASAKVASLPPASPRSSRKALYCCGVRS